MSRNMDWTDAFLGKKGSSTLPSDDFTPSNGTTFGLDSFNFDEPDGAGIADAQRLPTTRGLSGLPDGFVGTPEKEEDYQLTADEDGFILSQDDIGLAKDASVVQLDWLDPTEPQDEERLPNNEKTLDSVSQLEDLWGKDDNGQLVPNRDLEIAKYHESIEEPVHSSLPGQKNASDDQLDRETIFQVMRRAHFGPLPENKKTELLALLGGSARAKKVLATLDAESGLIGNVYVRASVFPGLRRGEWVKEVRRGCRTARYVITDDQSIAVRLGMQMVSEVPWKEALDYYKPVLAAVGCKVASGDPKKALQQAFLTGPRIPMPKDSHLPVVKPVVASEAEAREALQKVAEGPKVVTPEENIASQKRKEALVWLARQVKAGAISKSAAQKLYVSKLDSYGLMQAGAKLITAGKKVGSYAGAGSNNQSAGEREQPKKVAASIREVEGLVKWARRQMTEGMAGRELDSLLSNRFALPVLKAASEPLKSIRATHEGLAGHMYVDAGAYASPAGSAGCEQHASKHRANGVKLVLAMPRCESCVFKNADGVCSQYNKKLVSSLPANAPQMQQEMIRQANATDHENTAALFNPSEFNLTVGEMDDVPLNDSVTTEKLGNVLFGTGPELEE